MRKQFLAGVGAVALSVAFGGVALAADMPVAREPVYTKAPPLMDWSGFYAGGHVGWGRARFSGTWIDDSGGDLFPFSLKPSGILGGLHVGQNWQVNTFVYGWEADVSATSGWKKTISGFTNSASQGVTAKVSLLASLRGRLGMTLDPKTLVYVTGGLGYINAKATAFNSTVQNTAKFNSFGGVVGAGVEWKQAQNFSWRLEGLWYIFDKSKSIPVVVDQSATVKLKDALVVRAGATWHY